MTAADVHARTAERFSAYVEGELAAPDRAAVDAHLATCIQCRTNLEQFRRTIDNLSKLKKKAPASFLPDIQGQIHARSRGRFFGKRWMLFGRIPFEWVSLAMIVAMLLYYLVSLQASPTIVTPRG
jgi:predicted anti-sigma-YlaC factor YlaD